MGIIGIVNKDYLRSGARRQHPYRGHYAALAAYAEDLVDDYQLDAKLDAAIAEPFRRHVDIDVVALSQALAAGGQYYALRAIPIGVWIFADIE